MRAPTIVWFRRDLRLADHAPLIAALSSGPILPVYLHDEASGALGAAQCWWLHHSLAGLDAALQRRGGRLILLRGDVAALARLAHLTGAQQIYASAHAAPWAIAQDAALRGHGVPLVLHDGETLVPDADVRTGKGTRYHIFTPFWRRLSGRAISPPSDAPLHVTLPPDAPAGDRLEDWGLANDPWMHKFQRFWTPGEDGAWTRLQKMRDGLDHYAHARDFPDQEGGSNLSPHLHFGEISPRQIWAAVHDGSEHAGRTAFLRQLAWRDFARGVIRDFPHSDRQTQRTAYAHFPVTPTDAPEIQAWRRGRTGYPIVDAGMRQLWVSGWMHNRVRMIVASFLVKHLLGDWRDGLSCFRDRLLDADDANNALGWQWIMGCGVDSSPYGRIFSPTGQAQKYDPDGSYVRRWVPELARLPDHVIHTPWTASPDLLQRAGVTLGVTYPAPIVDHDFARTRALALHRRVMGKAG